MSFGTRVGSRTPVPRPGPGQRKYLCAGVPRWLYSVALSGDKTEIPGYCWRSSANKGTEGCLTKPDGKAAVSSCGTRVEADETLCRAKENIGRWNTSIIAVRLKVEENQLVGGFGEIDGVIDGLKGA